MKRLIILFCLLSFPVWGQIKTKDLPNGGSYTSSSTVVGTNASGITQNFSLTSLMPTGVAGSPQINNGDGTFYGAPLPTQTSYAPVPTSAAGVLPLPPAAYSAVSSGIHIDPRAYGARCTGWYGISSATIFAAGTGFQVGDKFLAQDDNAEDLQETSPPATGHVTAVNGSGGVTAFVLDTPGAGYHAGAMYTMPITGTGINFAINPTGLYSGPSAPTTTLASGGGTSSSSPIGAFKHVGGGSYNVGDLFAVPNPAQDGNYLVGRVDSVSSLHAVVTYHFYNYGGDYAIVNAVPAITLTGTGSGLTINVTSATSANHTFDDTYGLLAGIVAGIAAGGVTELPHNCWIGSLPVPSYTMLVGANDAPSYGYNADFQSANYGPVAERAPTLTVIKTPTYGIDFNGEDGQYLHGFQLEAYTGYGFGSSTTWDSTIGIGSSTVGKYTSGGNGSGGQAAIFISKVSAHHFYKGVGTVNAADPLVFLKLDGNDWGANNQNGLYGALSDLIENNDTIASLNGYCSVFTAGGGGRLSNNRCEFAAGGRDFENFGALLPSLVNESITRITYCGIKANGTQQVGIVGGTINGAGLAGSLKVTGAADNGSGLIRLTVTGQCSPSGGAATCNLVTGDIANVQGVTGTTEANANQWTITKVDNTHIDLQGSTFTNAYVSGGTVGVNGKDAQVCLTNTTGFFSTGVDYSGYSSGAGLPSAVIIDASGSTSISIIGAASKKGNGASNLDTYQQAFANWHNSGNTPPADTVINVIGQPVFDNTNIPTLSGLALTSTAGGIYAAGGLANTTTTATLTLSGLPPAPHKWNCTGGDTTLGNNWAMNATTSTSCGLAATTSTGDPVWYQGKPW